MQDVRWIQRFNNYKKALKQLGNAVDLMSERELSILEKQGVVQCFEYTHELAWKTLKDFLESKGNLDIYGSRDATKKAFALGLINDGEVWMHMIKSRNLTTHTYDEKTADEVIGIVKDSYFNLFLKLKSRMEAQEKSE